MLQALTEGLFAQYSRPSSSSIRPIEIEKIIHYEHNYLK